MSVAARWGTLPHQELERPRRCLDDADVGAAAHWSVVDLGMLSGHPKWGSNLLYRYALGPELSDAVLTNTIG